ncbi:MAG: sensor histidine kinase [Elusimicrobia bacterium]|nr:sensor histidine kinase [Elusimicrobiota bacterium]
MKIFHKLLLAFLAVSLLPLFVAGGLLLQEMERSLRLSALSQQDITVHRTAERVLSYLDNVGSLLGVVRGSADLQSPARRAAALESLLNNGSMFSELALLDPAGKEIERLSRSRDGRGTLLSDAPSAVRAAQTQNVYFGPVQFSTARYPLLPFCALLELQGGRSSGYLAGRLNLLDLSARMRGQEMGEGAILRVFDAQGRLVAHSSDIDYFKKAEAKRSLASEGEKRLGVKTGIPALGWTVVLEQPERVVFALERRVRQRVLWGLVLAIVAALVFGFAVARSLVRPLSDIRKAVEDLSVGRFKTGVGATSRDEIGVVAARLREAQGVLEAKVRQSTVGLLVHRIGHDLRQPLTAIRESLAVVRRHSSGADDVAHKHLNIIDQEIVGGIESIEELLTLGRERPPRLSVVALGAFVREAVSRTPVPSGIDVEMRDPVPGLQVQLDIDEVRRALGNALRNAFESGGSHVVVSVDPVKEQGWISVIDDGRGVPEEVRAKLFTDFLTTKPSGTGLGLGIIKRAVERSGGVVRLENNSAKGATLAMGFPLNHSAGGGDRG